MKGKGHGERNRRIFHPKPDLDTDSTLERLERLKAAGVKVRPHKDGGQSPRAFTWVDRGDVSYQITSGGAVTVYASYNDMPEACDFINEVAVDRNGKRPLFWSEGGESLGKKFLLEHISELEQRLRLFEKYTRSLNLPDPALLVRLKLLNPSILVDALPQLGESLDVLRGLNPSILVPRP